MIKKSPAKLRVRYWRRILHLQNTTKAPIHVDKTGKTVRGTKWKRILRGKSEASEVGTKSTPIIKKGSKQYEMIMELARMPPQELIKTAKQYYSKYDDIKTLLRGYKEGTEEKKNIKIRRKTVTITTGFPKYSPFITHLIRHRIINHERGMTKLDEKSVQIKATKQKWEGVKGKR